MREKKSLHLERGKRGGRGAGGEVAAARLRQGLDWGGVT